jgi:2-amino-4-hydroxy-6-hydroxymethyldihydropteridine diphosphokinase
MALVFLGLGSNIGDPASTILQSYSVLGRQLKEARISSLWRSRARYVEDQPEFVNAAVSGSTKLSPRSLLSFINDVEASFGRDRGLETKKGPRPLDIDILLYGSSIIAEEGLVIPHPGLNERKFALLPLLELAPELLDPISGRRYAEILAALPPQGIYLADPDRYDLIHT